MLEHDMDLILGVDADLPVVLNQYFYHGMHPGSFYKAIIHNDLRTALYNMHPLIDLKATIQFIDLWMRENDIDMEFLKNVDGLTLS